MKNWGKLQKYQNGILIFPPFSELLTNLNVFEFVMSVASKRPKISLRSFQIFYFLLPINRESIVLGSNFLSGDFDGFTLYEVP